MGWHVAFLLLGASLATGSTLAQVASPPPEHAWERIDAPFGIDVRLRGKGMPNSPSRLPRLEPWRSATGSAVDPWRASKSRHVLAYGTLMRTQLSDDASMMLRLRGGKLRLYLRVEMP